MLTILTARGVVQDGSLPVNVVPSVQVQNLAIGVDAQLNVNVVGSNNLPKDLTGAECVLALKKFEDDLEPLIQRLGVVTNALGGLVAFTLSENDTIRIGSGAYIYDITIIFPDSGRVQVVPTSTFVVADSPSDPTLRPTIPVPSQQGQAGKFLGTDGTNFSWQNTPGLPTGFNPRGAWTGNVAYTTNDVLTSAGGVYRCKSPVTSNTPPASDPTHWELWAASGVDPNTLLGSAVLPGSNAWVEISRYRPGVNKIGYFEVFAKGQTSLKTRLRVFDQMCFRTDADGNVYLQANLPAPVGGAIPTYAGALLPPAATGVAASEPPASGAVDVNWTNPVGNEVDGHFVEVSADGGATWDRILYSFVGAGATTVSIPVAGGSFVPPNTSLKFRVVGYNDFGESRSTIVDQDTDGSTSQVNNDGQPGTPDYPVSQTQYDDRVGYWMHFNGAQGIAGNLQLVIGPDGADIVVKARTQNGASGGISTRVTLSNGVAS